MTTVLMGELKSSVKWVRLANFLSAPRGGLTTISYVHLSLDRNSYTLRRSWQESQPGNYFREQPVIIKKSIFIIFVITQISVLQNLVESLHHPAYCCVNEVKLCVSIIWDGHCVQYLYNMQLQKARLTNGVTFLMFSHVIRIIIVNFVFSGFPDGYFGFTILTSIL